MSLPQAPVIRIETPDGRFEIKAHAASGWGIVISKDGQDVFYVAHRGAKHLRDWLCDRYGDPRKTLWQKITRRAKTEPLHY